MDIALLIVIGVAFVLARLFEIQAERDRKRFERARGNYCWRRHDDGSH